MGLRFRKVIKLAPGLRMNVGLRGLSMSLGPRGSSVSVGPSGVYGNVGFPGTGLSTRTRLGAGLSQGSSAQAGSPGQLSVSFRLQDDGTVEIVGADGSALPPRVVKLARTQNEQLLRAWLDRREV